MCDELQQALTKIVAKKFDLAQTGPARMRAFGVGHDQHRAGSVANSAQAAQTHGVEWGGGKGGNGEGGEER